MDKAELTVTVGDGVSRITVTFGPGAEATAFSLLTRALPAVQHLDRRMRGWGAPPEKGTRPVTQTALTDQAISSKVGM